MSKTMRMLLVLVVANFILTGAASASTDKSSLCTATGARAGSSIAAIDTIDAWNQRYPDSLSDDQIIAEDGRDCRLCHAFPNSGFGWNAYGWALRQESQDEVVEGQNSDGDPNGFTNLEEINANVQPGWTTGENIMYFADGATQTVNPPALSLLDAKARETTPPTGSITINEGAQYTNRRTVTLNLTALDNGGSGVFKVRLKNSGDTWTAWENLDANRSWTLAAGDGPKRVFLQVKDWAGNDSVLADDSIQLDTVAPSVSMVSPFVSTKISKSSSFKVDWAGSDSDSGLDSFTVRYRTANSRTWSNWKTNTKAASGEFQGSAGRTYYLRVKAMDKAGNYKWSRVSKTIIPYNEGTHVKRRIGFRGYQKNAKSTNYLTSVRCSYAKKHTLVYKIKNVNSLGLVTTKGKNRGRAKIYVDGKYVKTVDAHASSTKPRQLIFYRSFAKKKTHYIKIVNLGTPGRARFDVDGIVAGR